MKSWQSGTLSSQKKCMGKLDNVAKSAKTVLFVAIILSVIRQLTSHCVLIEDGRTAFVGDTASGWIAISDTQLRKQAIPLRSVE